MSTLRKFLALLIGLALLVLVASAATSLPQASALREAAQTLGTTWQALSGRQERDPPSGVGDAAPAVLPTPQTQPVAVLAAWSDWHAEQGLTEGAMALILPDGTLHAQGIGRTADQPVPVASLSKAVTGLCLDAILREQGRSWQTPLGDIAAEMSAAGVTPRGRAETLTLAALVAHRAGLAPDLTQGDMASRLHGGLGLHRRIAWEALAPDAIEGTAGTYFYSNTNYAVLGVVIEALTGEPYVTACQARVFAPAGVTAAVGEGRMGSMSSYGGWEVSAQDYARFAHTWFGPDAPPHAPGAPDGSYRLGYIERSEDGRSGVTHSGRLCSESRVSHNHGAVFIARPNGATFVANWNACLDVSAYGDLIARVDPFLR